MNYFSSNPLLTKNFDMNAFTSGSGSIDPVTGLPIQPVQKNPSGPSAFDKFSNDLPYNPLLGMAMGLLQAGGPSRMPTSLGQALGAGLGTAQQFQQSGFGNILAQQKIAQQQQAMQDQQRRQKLIDQILPTIGGAQNGQSGTPSVIQNGAPNNPASPFAKLALLNGQYGAAYQMLHPAPPSGEHWAPMSPQQKQQYGIAPTDQNNWMISNTGDVKIAGGAGYGSNPGDVSLAKDISTGIESGITPPDLNRYYRLAGPISAQLAKDGYNFTKAKQDWDATQKRLATLNGTQQTRLRESINQVDEALPLVKSLAQQWDAGNFPVLNKTNLIAAKQGLLGQDAQSLATRLDAEIADITAELSTVYMGGNTPTDHALELAAKQFNANWSKKTLMDAIGLAEKNVRYRKNSMSLGTGGIPVSQYNPMQKTSEPPKNPSAAPINNDPLGIR